MEHEHKINREKLNQGQDYVISSRVVISRRKRDCFAVYCLRTSANISSFMPEERQKATRTEMAHILNKHAILSRKSLGKILQSIFTLSSVSTSLYDIIYLLVIMLSRQNCLCHTVY